MGCENVCFPESYANFVLQKVTKVSELSNNDDSSQYGPTGTHNTTTTPDNWDYGCQMLTVDVATDNAVQPQLTMMI